MDIMLEIVSRHKYTADFSTAHLFGEAGGIIGRSDECDWVLPDRAQQVSRKHALITFFNGAFHIEDTSANGVFSSLGMERLPRGTPVRIEHGDGFVIGEYTIMARLMQNPDSYAEPVSGGDSDPLAAKSVPLNPIRAMDQEEERIAAERLGYFNGILGGEDPGMATPSDHAEARFSALPHISAIPEAACRDGADPWAIPAALHAEAETDSLLRDIPIVVDDRSFDAAAAAVPETEVFFRTLGYAAAPEDPRERERILHLAAQLLAASVAGLAQAMQNRAECKKELRLPVTTTCLAFSNNPLKFSPTAEAALSTLLAPRQKGVMDPVEAVKTAFHDLHAHHMGLLAGARAASSSVLRKLAPDALEARLDANGPVRMARSKRLWHLFTILFHQLRDDREGFAALLCDDVARAYELQVRTLNPAAHRRQQGDAP
ncbi:MAG: type VI secretion system-associated FHA domain protein TagH [Deltaproteobacteria bacterium]|jgi:type VI secretion system protein ImpI|nr:type VI secretion system-associated FHA domain protein TagH [Deltaproteobacteria bacterium]